MKSVNQYVIKVLATGFVVLVVLSILLFWTRKLCQTIFYENLYEHTLEVTTRLGQVQFQPSGLLPELDNATEIVRKSSINAYIENDVIADSLGIVRDIWGLENGKIGRFFVTIRDNKRGAVNVIVFDKNSGLLVFYDVFKVKRGWGKKATLYAGPKGVSEIADKNLGRFSGPRNNLWVWRFNAGSLIFFDKSQTCFFQIRFADRSVAKSSQLSEVVQLGWTSGFNKDGESLRSLTWSPPLRKQTPLEEDGKKKIRGTVYEKDGTEIDLVSAISEGSGAYWAYSEEDILVLESDGTIRRLDSMTLEISDPVGYLPSAVDSSGRARPEELFSYAVRPFVVDDEYSGTIAASISREAMEIQVAVFDKDGKLIERKGSHIDPFSKPGGPALVIINYLLENLQPGFGGLVSYFTASTFEAVDGHAGLFILPNSLVAIFGREADGIVGPLFGAVGIISPSIILGILLGFAVYKDATVTGFSKRARRYWVFGTILFGLSAYVTYRLTRPKITLVTCENCGKVRRPDMEQCHQCGSAWHVPELVPPSWRVVETS